MGRIKPAPKAKLFAGIMYSNEKLCKKAVRELEKKFGRIEEESSPYDFTQFSNYYCDEIGEKVLKKFVVFSRPIDRASLASIKIWTNKLEQKLAKNGKRKINIDPGYLTIHNLVLASTKDRSHRIYLGKGIYADLTLLFDKNGCRQFSHTFPDFRSEIARDFFWKLREKFKKTF